MGKIIVLVGPSGSGKTSVSDALIAKTDCVKVTTCTTRQPRNGEINGIHYHFLSNDEFEHELLNGEFVETFNYAGNRYGTRYKELNEICNMDKNVVMVMEINGAREIQKHFPKNTYIVFLKREFRDLVMAILERKISDEEKADRIAQIPKDMEVAYLDCIDYIIPNENGKILETVEKIKEEIL